MNTKLNTPGSTRSLTRRAVWRGNPRLSIFNLIVLAGLMLSSACRSTGPAPAPLPTPTPTESGLGVVDNGAPLPPLVVEHQPAGGQELSTHGEILLVFNQAMNPETTTGAWQLIDAEKRAVKGQVDWTNPNTLRFKPAEALKNDAIYHGLLDVQATSREGIALAEPVDLEFQTIGELQVSQVFPLDGTMDVANNAVITAIFNRPVVPLVIAEEQDKLPNPLEITPALRGHGEWINTSVFAFQPDEPLKGAVTYQVTVKSGLADAVQESRLAEDYSWEFTTITPRIQSLRLSNGTENPPDSLENILLDEYFTLTFFQPMNVSNSEAALSLTPEGGEPVALTKRWNEDDTQVIITPTQRLALGTTYGLVLDASAQAADGGTLDQGLSWNFTTVPEPAVLSITPPEEGPQGPGYNQQLYIKFASPMNIESVKKNIVITPKPEGEIQWWYDEYDWSISAFILKPSTRYEVRALPGMMDIYGNATQREHVVRFTNPAAPSQAGLQMPWEPSVIRAGGSQEFYITYRNIRSVNLRLSSVTPEQFIALQGGSLDRYSFKPPDDTLVWKARQASTGKLNELVLKPLTPVAASGDPLAPGFYFLSLDSPEIPHPPAPYLDNRQLIVASANLTFKSSTTQALMWLTDLESGQPLKGIQLTVFDKNFKAIGKGVTDADGLLKLDVPAPQDPYDKRFAMTSGDGPVFAFASSEWGSGANLYDYGLWSSYYAPANQPKVYVYTDRPIYRPNQPVYFKGIVRLDDDLSYSQPEQREVHIKIDNFKETVYEADLPLSDIGSFDGGITLDPEATLGYYNLSVLLPAKIEPIGGVGFTVAEYRKPEFQVKVTADPKDVLAGQNFTVEVAADFYSGGVVGDAQVDWTLNASPFYFSPSGEYSGYSFRDDERDLGFYEGYNPPTTETIAQGQGRTDADGKYSQTLPADLSEAKTSREFTFEATITDLSKNAVSGRATIIAHRSAVYPGVRPKSYVGAAGQDQSFDIVALDWDSKPISGQKATVEIVERKWYSVQEQDATGRVQWKSTVEEVPVTSIDVTTDERGKATASFLPPHGGVYRARVTVLDGSGNTGSASAFLWVAGPDFIPWRQTNDRSFDLIADRTSYAPGDTAEILIASPFQGESYALVTVERGHIFQQEVIHLTSNSTVYKLPITSDLAPNAYISVVVVKGIDESNPRPNFKMGIVELKVDTSQQKVLVSISPDPPQAGPGDRVTYTVNTTDDQGRPVAAELSLGLSDLATLSLVGPNSMPILDFFYDHRTLGVWTTIPIFLSLEDYNATIQEQIAQGSGMGSGGGKGEGDFGVIGVRQNFPDTAFWDAHVQTGEEGQAQVTVTLPDNLTTWRMDARAVTQDTHVGQATQDLISTRPLLVRPQTPRFFVVGDRASLGAVVNNNTDQSLTVQVSLQAQGVNLQSDATQQVDIPAKRQAAVSWEVSVDNDASRVDLVFSAEGGGYQDASRPPQGTLDNQGIPVYRFTVPETVGTSGQMTAGGTRIEAISLPSTLTTSEGSLTIRIAPSLAAGMTDGLTYLKEYPYECIEQTISRFLPNVISTRALKSAGLSDPELEANLQTEVNTALQRLVNWQKPDGGWGWWPGADQKSDPLTTAYVVVGLVEAKDAGYSVNEAVVARATTYLHNQISPIARLAESHLLNRQAFLLFAIARAGNPDVSASVQLYDQRQNIALYGRAFLARTLYLIDPEDTRLKTLLSDFASSAITSATGTHWEEKEQDTWNWNTDTRTTAIVLSTLSALDTSNPLNANAVRWLMSNRNDGHWRGTQETAWTLMALTNWMEASGELQANYQYAVALNGQRLGGGTADRETLRQTTQLQVTVADMLQDQANRLAFARDDGPGNLYYTAHLDVRLPVDQVRALDQGIIVTRSYYAFESDPTRLANAEPVTQVKQGDLLLVRLTLVAPNALHYVLVEDPLPAGLEAVDQSLDTSAQNLQVPQTYNWEDVFSRGWGWWYFDHTQLRDEKLVLSASYLPAGTYIYTYLARAGTAGTFNAIPPTAQEFYFPEVYGRGDGGQFVVNP